VPDASRAAPSGASLFARLARWLRPEGRAGRTPRRPPALVYALADKVPLGDLLPLAAQHAMLAATFFIYPVLVAGEAGLSPDQASGMVSACAMCAGITTILQCLRSRIGSGYLSIHIPSAGAIPLAAQALSIGGLGLMAATTLLVGICQMFMSRIVRPMRVLLPPEVCGVAVLMLGISLAGPALKRALGLDIGPGTITGGAFLASAATLGLIVAITIFAPKRVKLFAVLAGAAGGWTLAILLDVGNPAAAQAIAAAPILALPSLTLPDLAIAPSLLPLIALLVLMNLMDALSVIISLEKMNDADWRRADMGAVGRAVATNGFGNVLNGLAGGFQSGFSSSSVGLAFATQATARVIGVAAGVMIFAIAFLPKAIVALTHIPSPVVGGILLYTAAYLVTAGMDLVTSRRLSERRVFVVGLAVLAGLSVALLPVRDAVPEAVRPLFATPLTLGALTAIALNLLFRIGIARETAVAVPEGTHAFPFARDFLERQGDLWGARRDVIASAIPIVAQALELVADSGIASGPVELRARFDETHLDVYLLYDGEVVEPPKERPSPEALLGDAAEVAAFTAYMIKRLSDHVRFGRSGGKARIALRFDH